MAFTVNEDAAYELGYAHARRGVKIDAYDQFIPNATDAEKLAWRWGWRVSIGNAPTPSWKVAQRKTEY